MQPRIVIISLATAQERRRQIAERMTSVGMDFSFFDALDGDDSEAVENAFVCRPDFEASSFTYRDRPVSHRELACTISHLRAIHAHCRQDSGRPLLMLEDDALLCHDDVSSLRDILSRLPSDAAYLQFDIKPASTIEFLARTCQSEGGLFFAKNGTCTAWISMNQIGVHGTAAYLLAPLGIRAISDHGFEDERVIFPCHEEQVRHNVALVSDRLVYQAAVRRGGLGYVCALPVFTTVGTDSHLHADHVDDHAAARNAALHWGEVLKSRRELGLAGRGEARRLLRSLPRSEADVREAFRSSVRRIASRVLAWTGRRIWRGR